MIGPELTTLDNAGAFPCFSFPTFRLRSTGLWACPGLVVTLLTGHLLPSLKIHLRHCFYSRFSLPHSLINLPNSNLHKKNIVYRVIDDSPKKAYFSPLIRNILFIYFDQIVYCVSSRSRGLNTLVESQNGRSPWHTQYFLQNAS